MKDFMMVFIGPNYSEMGLSPEDVQNRIGKWWGWQQKMEAKGILKGGSALKPEIKRISGVERIVSDGPFVESKEIIGGYYLVMAENAEEVVEIAQDFPDYDLGGTVEIREIMVFDR